jgi:hypothetical protein
MRLPVLGGEKQRGAIDEPEAIRLIRHAIDSGVNYLDTAYGYHSGQSEGLVGKALRDGYRERVHLATKLPVWMVKGPGDFDRLLAEQLGRLQTGHIDCYLFHALNGKYWREVVLRHGLLEKAAAALADGRIRQLGFSFHGEFADFAEILDGSDLWSFCQIQYNYVNVEDQAGMRGLKLAAGRGLAVVVMEPLMGGRLADPPAEILRAMEGHPQRRTPVEWALDWLWDQPEVSVVLSGMSSFAQVEDNLRLAGQARAHCFNESDQALVNELREGYRARTVVPCTRCGYCLPCPTGVDIPANLEFFNYAHAFDDAAGARIRYNFALQPSQRASECVQCGNCDELCPQKIAVSEWMPKVAELLG